MKQKKTAASEIAKLRIAGFTAETDFMERSLKAQMKYANKIDCRFVAILGDEEVQKGTLALRSMETGEQTEVKISELAEALKRE